MDVKKVLKEVGAGVKQHSPAILTGMGTIGFVTTVVLSVKATPKALDLIAEEKNRRFNDDEDPEAMTTIDIVKVAWKPYIPAAVLGVASIGCFVGAQGISGARNVALAGAYSVAEKTIDRYKDELFSNLDEEKAQEVVDHISKKALEDAEKEKSPEKIEKEQSDLPAIIAGNGSYLCWDSMSDRYFRSDKETIRRAVNDFNQELIGGTWMDLNDWYSYVGLPSIPVGEALGWSSMKLLDVKFSAQVSQSGEPCIVVDYYSLPTTNFKEIG